MKSGGVSIIEGRQFPSPHRAMLTLPATSIVASLLSGHEHHRNACLSPLVTTIFSRVFVSDGSLVKLVDAGRERPIVFRTIQEVAGVHQHQNEAELQPSRAGLDERTARSRSNFSNLSVLD